MDEMWGWMGVGVIGGEDEKFGEEWGFDVGWIDKGVGDKEGNEKRIGGG